MATTGDDGSASDPGAPTGHTRRNLRGFSLIELVLVVALIGMIAGLAIPRFAEAVTRQRVETAVQRVLADLALVREAARHTGKSLTIEFDVIGQRYVVQGLPNLDHSNQNTYEVRLGRPPYEVELVAVDFETGSELKFDGYGVPVQSGTITLRAGDETRVIGFTAPTSTVQVSESWTPPKPVKHPTKIPKGN